MAAIRDKGFSPARLRAILLQLPAVRRYWVGFSGGLDSHVLLHALAQLRASLSPVEVLAVHVDHGLQASSAAWSRHCAAICADLHIPYRSLSIDATPAPGASPEAAARDARYQAISRLIETGDCLLTAHHQDDQAETLLIQLLRGAGMQGLASMPLCSAFAHGLHARPLLEIPQSELRAYAHEQGLRWIEDHSNQDRNFDRNYLRHAIMPLLRARWPAVSRTLSRSAHHAAEAAQLLAVVAQSDLDSARCLKRDTLSISALLALGDARTGNLLRAWLAELDLPMPSAAHVEHILKDILHAPADRVSCMRWPGAELRRYRDLLFAMPPLPAHDGSACLVWDMSQTLIINGIGQLSARSSQGSGLSKDLCHSATVTVRFRRGGERCQLTGRAHHHELKKLLQEHGIPPWQRDRIPLVYINDELAAVGDLWICQPFHANAFEEGVELELHPFIVDSNPSGKR